MSVEENKQVVHEFFSAMSNDNPEGALALLANDIVWTIIGDTKELNIHGAHLGPHAYPLAIDYIHRGMIDVGQFVTHQLSLEQYVEAFEMVQKGTDSIKVQLIP